MEIKKIGERPTAVPVNREDVLYATREGVDSEGAYNSRQMAEKGANARAFDSKWNILSRNESAGGNRRRAMELSKELLEDVDGTIKEYWGEGRKVSALEVALRGADVAKRYGSTDKRREIIASAELMIKEVATQYKEGKLAENDSEEHALQIASKGLEMAEAHIQKREVAEELAGMVVKISMDIIWDYRCNGFEAIADKMEMKAKAVAGRYGMRGEMHKFYGIRAHAEIVDMLRKNHDPIGK